MSSYEKLNKEIAFNFYLKQSVNGDSLSLLRLGDYYYYGFLEEPNYNLSLKYYRMAASLP